MSRQFHSIVAAVFFVSFLTSFAVAVNVLDSNYTSEIFSEYSVYGRVEDIAFDNNGNLYATNPTSGTIWKVTPDGTAAQFASGLTSPRGIEWTGGTVFGNNLYVVEYNPSGGGILKIDTAGNVTNFGNMPSGGHAALPIGLDRSGN